MTTIYRKIRSERLRGITKLDKEHRDRAEMHSTGTMVLVREDAADPKNWFIEYVCEVCNETTRQWNADTNDIIREVLKGEGIIKS